MAGPRAGGDWPEALPRLEEIRLDGARWRSHCCSAFDGSAVRADPRSPRRAAPSEILKTKAGRGRQSRPDSSAAVSWWRLRSPVMLLWRARIVLRVTSLASVDPASARTGVESAHDRPQPRSIRNVQIAGVFPAGHRTDAAIPGQGRGRDQRAPADALTANFALVIEDRPDTLVSPDRGGTLRVTPVTSPPMGIPLERGRFISDPISEEAS